VCQVGRDSFTLNSKRLPMGFLLALVLIALFEVFNAVFDDYFYFTPFDGFRIKIKNELSQSGENRFDILAVGDCYGIVGIIPAILENKTGLTCFNFSTHRNQTILASYCLLKNYLERCSKKPKYIIVSFLYHTMRDERDMVKQAFFYDYIKGNFGPVIKEFGIEQCVKFLIPSLKHQDILDGYTQDPRLIVIQNKTTLDEFRNRVIYLDKGYYPRNEERVFQGSNGDPILPDFSVSPFFRKYLDKILELAVQNHTRVIYLVPTVPFEGEQPHTKYTDINDYSDYVQLLKKEYPDLIILSPQDMLRQKDLYRDTIHLNQKGARMLSVYLSQEINRLSGNKRLPATARN
jgi:hypothetical protein